MTLRRALLVIALFALVAFASMCHTREQTRRDTHALEKPFALRLPHLTPPEIAPPVAPVSRRPPGVVIPQARDLARLPVTPPSAAAGGPRPLDQPMARAWPAVNRWSPAIEEDWVAFAAGLGRAIATHRCRGLAECLRDPSANTLYDAATDAGLNMVVDCGDLPYVLRAYFAFKRRLPFGFVSYIRGDPGRDPRYTLNVRPDGFLTWQRFATPRELIQNVGDYVHTGMYRTAPGVENSDFYQVSISRRTVRPGTIFYDPNGHVLVVTEVRADGQVFLIDGHPDGTLTYKRFGEAFVTGTARLGGGFKNFRPQRWVNGRIERFANAELPGFDGLAQFDRSGYVVAGAPSTYHAWVRASLAESNVVIDPVAEFREQVRSICRDVSDRVDAVNIAVASGIARQPHPASLPENIYGTVGDWEDFSTPSRDARLKASFRELHEFVADRADRATLAAALLQAWREEAASPECSYQYTRSNGAVTRLTVDTVLDRIYQLSFDPYQCIELRWGAPSGSEELASCHDTPDRLHWYADEHRLRNRIDREYGVPTPLTSGPEEPADIDVRRLLTQLRASGSGG